MKKIELKLNKMNRNDVDYMIFDVKVGGKLIGTISAVFGKFSIRFGQQGWPTEGFKTLEQAKIALLKLI